VPDADLPRVADVEFLLPGGGEQFLAEVAPSYQRVFAHPKGALDPARLNSPEWRRACFPAISLHASATALARFYAGLTSPDGPVRALLGQELHGEYLSSQACGVDETVGLRINWTLGPLRTDAFTGLGGLGGSAAWWSPRHGHGVAYVTRRLHDFVRVARIAAALDDNINMVVSEC
jgi:hypothetical protein